MSNSCKILIVLIVLVFFIGMGIWWFISIQEEIAAIENINNPKIRSDRGQTDYNQNQQKNTGGEILTENINTDDVLSEVDEEISQIEAQIAEANSSLSQE